jgi:orotidine-5'-phosphate decarboxylase
MCLGLDPSRELVGAWGLADDAPGLARFCAIVIEAAGDRLAVVKPQSAFFERLGPAGMAQLARVTTALRDQGALSLLDCKRGDMAATMEGYAQAMLGEESGFGADAMTVTAWLGFQALRPALDRAAEVGAAVFVVVRSSNPEGRVTQDAVLADGRALADGLADEITAYNAALGEGVGPVGAVMGATLTAADAATLARLPRSLILAPGVGAQGATIADIAANFGPAVGRTLPSASRSILRCGPSISALREAIDRARDEAWAMAEGAGPQAKDSVIAE